MSRFDTIVVGNDFVSEHWLAEQFPATVTKARAAWKEREEHSKTTPRSGLVALAGEFGSALVRLRESRDREALRALHATVRAALGLPDDEPEWAGLRASGEMSVRAAVAASSTGTNLLVLQAHDASTVEDLLDAGHEDSPGAGRLLDPAVVDGEPVEATAAVISRVFGVEHPPPLVLVTAGAWLLLAERSSWPEGRWLAVDLATALERRDTRAAGELETIAALVSADALVPEADGTAPLLGLLEESVKHAVGVSKALRNGVKESVELIASEVLRRRRGRGLPDDVPDLARDLTRQSLRYLYRILFLLYAEARPELGVLPVGAPEYAEGYGLDRMRELVLTELTSAAAQHGTHLYSSLSTLFRLVNEGHGATTELPDDEGGLRFEALRADLFETPATVLIDEVGLGNACLQQVLRRLLLSQEKRGRDRGFVSYAQLGINQLGAVYEGLMSYSGSIARDEMVEVAKDGNPERGSWVVPLSATRGFDEAWFVTRRDETTGENVRVTYSPGDFVFRLSGRDRQRSASYYTPEVLTRCVVTHSLAELLSEETTAAQVLALTVCEPALGSGAFLVEAINQLADQYLTRRQHELDREIPPEDYQAEKQQVKAYLALHQCYGVDLNATAVELAEITLWLDAMHPGLQAPWFGLHLRRGNSLIGARRETYTPAEVAKRGWLTTVPTARPLSSDEGVDPKDIHHFLLPAAGWGAVADTKEAKEGRPEAAAELKAWRKSVTSALSATEVKRLQGLARRVEVLWALATRRLTIAEAEIRRPIDVWGSEALELPVGIGAVQREQIEESLFDSPDSAYRRLRRVMDAWAALWFWPVTRGETPPTREQWLSALESLLGTTSKAETKAGRGMFGDDATWDELDDVEANERSFAQMASVGSVLAAHPWLRICQEIANREGFFHWELDFAPVFAAAGGFDLQLGNPPWVRPDWDDNLVLAEEDAWFGLADKPSVVDVRQRRQEVLDDGDTRYIDERTSLAGTSAHLRSGVDRPLLTGTHPDLYRCFMDRTWRSAGAAGVVGLIHPESHFTEARATGLRRATYTRLRRRWQFRNVFKRLFEEIDNGGEFSVSIYAWPISVRFLSASSLYWPDVVDRSLQHDGSGPEPGLRHHDGSWDLTAHAARIVAVDEEVLSSWAALIDEPGTPPLEARMLRPVTRSSQEVLDKIATAPRFDSVPFQWTRGWEEDADRRTGWFVARSEVPTSLDDVILQGPHFTVATPNARQPNPTMRSNKDYTQWDLERLPERAIPRTSYQRSQPTIDYVAAYPHWEGTPSNHFWRLAWRNMVDSSTVRSCHAALLPPGPTHVHGVHTLSCPEHRDLAIAGGMWASLPVDFLVKVSGASKLQAEFAARFPHPRDHALVPELILRTLRLNCLTTDYEPLWAELFNSGWERDAWTRRFPAAALGDVGTEWSMSTPLRRDAERRQALVEIDALAAVMLDITADELCAIYRTQFGVLRKYERVMRFDANGRQVPKDVLKDYEKYGTRADLGRYELPFTGVDREREMTIAHEEFSRRLAERTAAMQSAD